MSRTARIFTAVGYVLLGLAAVLTVMVIIVGGNGASGVVLLGLVGLGFVGLGVLYDIRAAQRGGADLDGKE